ncbi:MAG: hypothetical protein WCT01_05210 [Candidatus Shapirobacteria bacterium]
MNKILAPIGILVLLAALAGGVALTQRSANIQRSADEYFVYATLIPTTKKVMPGETLTVLLKLDSGDAAKKVFGADVSVEFDRNAWDLVAVKPVIVDEEILYPVGGGYLVGGEFKYDIGSGPIKILSAQTGTEYGGVVDLAKLVFKSKIDGGVQSKIKVGGVAGVRTVTGQVTIKESVEAVYTLGDEVVVPAGNEPSPEPVGCRLCGNNCQAESACSLETDDLNYKCEVIGNVCTKVDSEYPLICKELYNTMVAAYYSKCGEAKYNPVADFNKDGQVRGADFSLIAANVQNVEWCAKTQGETTSPCEVSPAVTVKPSVTIKPSVTVKPSISPSVAPSQVVGESCPVCSTEKPALTLVKDTSGKIFLGIRWQDVNNNEDGYGVRYCVGTGCAPSIGVINTGSNVSSHLDLGPGGKGYLEGNLIRIRVRGMKTNCSLMPCPISEITVAAAKAITLASWNAGGGAKASVVVTPTPTKIVTPPLVPTLPLTGGACNSRCGDGVNCQEGMVCFPVGLGNCNPINPTILNKIGQSPLTTADKSVISQACPDASSASVNGAADPQSVYGFCRKPACLNSTSCNCSTSTVPTPIEMSSRVMFTGSRVVSVEVGQTWKNQIKAVAGKGTLSSVQFLLKYDPKKVRIKNLKLFTDPLDAIVKNELNNNLGQARVIMSQGAKNLNKSEGYLGEVEWETIIKGSSWINLTAEKLETKEDGVKKTYGPGKPTSVYVLVRDSLLPQQ